MADKPTEEAPVEGKTEAKVEEAKPEPEVEEKTMTLEEYRKSKKSAIRNPNAKQASAPVEGKKVSTTFIQSINFKHYKKWYMNISF